MTDLPENLRAEAACEYLKRQYGIKRTVNTLAVLRSIGGGPRFRRDGRIVLYPVSELDKWANEHLTRPVETTAELTAA